MSKHVTAIYKDARAASLAVDSLLDAGVAGADVSVLVSESTQGREFGLEASTKAPEGAAAGGAIGVGLGSIAAGLVAVGTIAAPGIGLVAAGPLLAGLAGAGAGAAAGGVVGGLVGLGIPEHEAKLYADEIAEGRILLGVHVHADRVKRAKETLENTGGHAIRG